MKESEELGKEWNWSGLTLEQGIFRFGSKKFILSTFLKFR